MSMKNGIILTEDTVKKLEDLFETTLVVTTAVE